MVNIGGRWDPFSHGGVRAAVDAMGRRDTVPPMLGPVRMSLRGTDGTGRSNNRRAWISCFPPGPSNPWSRGRSHPPSPLTLIRCSITISQVLIWCNFSISLTLIWCNYIFVPHTVRHGEDRAGAPTFPSLVARSAALTASASRKRSSSAMKRPSAPLSLCQFLLEPVPFLLMTATLRPFVSCPSKGHCRGQAGGVSSILGSLQRRTSIIPFSD